MHPFRLGDAISPVHQRDRELAGRTVPQQHAFDGWIVAIDYRPYAILAGQRDELPPNEREVAVT